MHTCPLAQASVPFYESFGFVRVGAVSRHQQKEEQVMTHLTLYASSSRFLQIN